MTPSLLKRFEDASKHWDIASSVRPLIDDFLRTALTELKEEMKAEILPVGMETPRGIENAMSTYNRFQNAATERCIAILDKALTE